MCSPGDSRQLERLTLSLDGLVIYEATRRSLEIGVEAQLTAEVAMVMADREDPVGILEALLKKDWLGHIASGYILRYVISRWHMAETRHEASLANAAAVFEEWCTVNRITGGMRQNVTRALWKKYGCVSHLWAAYYLTKDAHIDLSVHPETS